MSREAIQKAYLINCDRVGYLIYIDSMVVYSEKAFGCYFVCFMAHDEYLFKSPFSR